MILSEAWPVPRSSRRRLRRLPARRRCFPCLGSWTSVAEHNIARLLEVCLRVVLCLPLSWRNSISRGLLGVLGPYLAQTLINPLGSFVSLCRGSLGSFPSTNKS